MCCNILSEEKRKGSDLKRTLLVYTENCVATLSKLSCLNSTLTQNLNFGDVELHLYYFSNFLNGIKVQFLCLYTVIKNIAHHSTVLDGWQIPHSLLGLCPCHLGSRMTCYDLYLSARQKLYFYISLNVPRLNLITVPTSSKKSTHCDPHPQFDKQ